MSNEQQILNLIAQYAHYVDQGAFDKVGELFAEGTLLSPGQELKGKESVANQLKQNLQIFADGTPRTAHLNTNTVLNIEEEKDEATAVSTSYLTILPEEGEKGFSFQSIAVGRYDDTFIRKNGQWHFSVRKVTISLVSTPSKDANGEEVSLENILNKMN